MLNGGSAKHRSTQPSGPAFNSSMESPWIIWFGEIIPARLYRLGRIAQIVRELRDNLFAVFFRNSESPCRYASFRRVIEVFQSSPSPIIDPHRVLACIPPF